MKTDQTLVMKIVFYFKFYKSKWKYSNFHGLVSAIDYFIGCNQDNYLLKNWPRPFNHWSSSLGTKIRTKTEFFHYSYSFAKSISSIVLKISALIILPSQVQRIIKRNTVLAYQRTILMMIVPTTQVPVHGSVTSSCWDESWTVLVTWTVLDNTIRLPGWSNMFYKIQHCMFTLLGTFHELKYDVNFGGIPHKFSLCICFNYILNISDYMMLNISDYIFICFIWWSITFYKISMSSPGVIHRVCIYIFIKKAEI